MKRLGATLAWTLVAILALAGSLVYHLQLDLAGVVAVESVTALLDREIQGTIEIGSIRNEGYGRVVARNVVFRDPDGEEVVHAERLDAWPNWGMLLSGVIYVDRAHVRGGAVTLRAIGEEGDRTVSIAETFMPTRPSDGEGSGPPHIVIDGIVIDEILVRGDVPGYEGMRFEDVRAVGRVEIDDDVIVRVYDGRAEMTGPYPGRTDVDRIVGHVNGDLTEGVEFFARGHRADDRYRARLRVWRPEEEEPLEMDLRVRFHPVRVETLAEMEVAPGLENLSGTFRGTARLQGPTDDLRLSGDVTSDAGRVHVRGHLPSEGPLTFDAWTQDRLQVDGLVPLAPEIRAGGRARLILSDDPESGEPRRTLHAEVEPFTLQDVAIPALTLDANIEDEALAIEELHTDHLGGDTSARGRVGFDGSLDVHVTVRVPEISEDPNVQRYAPDARGALGAQFEVRADAGAENLRFDGRLSMRRARYGNIRADSLTARGRVSGGPPAPEVDVEGEASGLRIGELSLGEANVTLRGGRRGYELHAESADARTRTRARVDGRARVTEDHLRLETDRLSLDLGDGNPWEGDLDLTVRPGHSVEVNPLRLERAGERAVARGTYRFSGDDDIDVELTNVDLSQVERLAPEQLEGIGGRVDAHLVLRGDLDRRPQGELSARVRDASLHGLTGVDGSAELQLEGQTLETAIRLDMGEQGALSAQGPIELTRAALRRPERIMEEADLSGLAVRTENLDLTPFLAAAGIDAPVSGRLSTNLSLSGTPRDPGVRDAVLILDHIDLEGWDPLRAKLAFSYDDERVTVRRFWLGDADGELAEGEGELPFDVDDPPDDLRSFWRLLDSAPWRASLRLSPRRLDSYPRPLREHMPPGVELGAEIDAYGDEEGPHATYRVDARALELSGDAHCHSQIQPQIRLEGSLNGRAAEAHVRGYAGPAEPVLLGTISASLPLEQWIADGEVARFPATEVRARVLGAPMNNIPYLCTYGTGPIYGSVTAKDILTDRPILGAILDLPALRFWEQAGERGEARLSDPFRVHVRTGSTPERDALTACVIMGLSGHEGTPGAACREVTAAGPGEMITRLRVPISWSEGELIPRYEEDAIISGWSDLRDVHVEPVLPFIPGVVAGDAVMTGQMRAEGPLESIQMSGALDLSDGHIQIEGLGQHLHGIRGRVELHGDRAVFPESHPLRASDSGGTAVMQGHVRFEGIVPRELEMALEATTFPIRREGMVLARLTGDAAVTGTIDAERTTTTIRTGPSFTIGLPEQTAASLQPLEPHPQIQIVGSERIDQNAHDEAYEIAVEVDASNRFWVRRNDFAVQLDAQLTALYRDPYLFLGGRARILRGTFEFFGKRFELQEGSINFDPDSRELNPDVNVVAVYDIPGRRGASVTVTVTGTLTHPQVAFQSTVADDQAEIISLLVGGGQRQAGTASQAAEEQATSFLAGVMTGLLTLGLRQEFGEVVPVLSIESQGLGGTRIRVGFSADDLIPEFLRGFIQSAYVEGSVTAAGGGTNAGGSSSGSGGVGGGVMLEFTFPENILMRGTWVPVDNGSLDLVWEP